MKKILVSLFIFMQYATYAQVVGTPQMFIPFPDPTSNGTAVVSAYSSIASVGTLVVGTPVSGVTQTIRATVTTKGTYDISTTANGVTFAASGTFAGTGAQDIMLTATGTPTASIFTLNTSPNCNFSRITNPPVDPSSNGTAVVSAYSCSTAYGGTLLVGTPVSGVTQTITATVTTSGTYSISATANGVTFDGAGTFASTGVKTIVLTASGTPTAVGSNNYAFNTTPNCSFIRNGFVTATGVYANVNGITKDFASHNLGANLSSDRFTYLVGNADGSGGTLGYLYQWGRQADGHQLRNSTTQAGPVAAPVANRFITTTVSPHDWRSTQSNTLWGDGTTGADPAKSANDPCPSGFKVPSQAQWNGLFRTVTTWGAPNTATFNTFTWTGNGFLIGQKLYLPAAGQRSDNIATLSDVGTRGVYWSSTVYFNYAFCFYFNRDEVQPDAWGYRRDGLSVRCISE
jgi:uncharacterized protein (TIGR02145 family)